jgi:mRNA interferase MazF
MVEKSASVPSKFEVFLINLNPTHGSEIQKRRPCVVISPNEMNIHLSTVIVAPMTTKIKKYPTRITLEFDGKKGQIALDQMRTIDKTRLIKKLGNIERRVQKSLVESLIEMFRD